MNVCIENHGSPARRRFGPQSFCLYLAFLSLTGSEERRVGCPCFDSHASVVIANTSPPRLEFEITEPRFDLPERPIQDGHLHGDGSKGSSVSNFAFADSTLQCYGYAAGQFQA